MSDEDEVARAVHNFLCCPLCSKVFANPVANQTCGHTFCEACINHAIERGCFPVADGMTHDDGALRPKKRRRKITFQCPVCLLPAFKWSLVRLSCVDSFIHTYQSGLRTRRNIGFDTTPAESRETEKEEEEVRQDARERLESSPLFPESVPLFAPCTAVSETTENCSTERSLEPAPCAAVEEVLHDKAGGNTSTLASFIATPPPSPPHEHISLAEWPGRDAVGHFVSPLQIRGATDDKMHKLLLDEAFAAASPFAHEALARVRLATRNLGGFLCNPPKGSGVRLTSTPAESTMMTPTHCIVASLDDVSPPQSIAVCEALLRNQRRLSDADPITWVVNMNWIEESLRIGRWADPALHEVIHTPSARSLLRLTRLRPKYVPPLCDIFAHGLVVFVAERCPDDGQLARTFAGVRVALLAEAAEVFIVQADGAALTKFSTSPERRVVLVATTPSVVGQTTSLAAHITASSTSCMADVQCLSLNELVDSVLDGRPVAAAGCSATSPAAQLTRRPLLYS